MAGTLDMTTGKPAQLMIRFSLPILLGSVINILYFTGDGIIVGRFIGVNAFAAVGVSARIMWLMLSVQFGLSAAFSSVFARCFGAKDERNLHIAAAMALWVIAVFGGFISIGAFVGRPLF